MCPIYVKLFNLILKSGYIPEDWVIGIIVPIYKNKGSAVDPSNYRDISLLENVEIAGFTKNHYTYLSYTL